ncbi:MAG: hypothetical protein J5689_01110 [Clostridia bacterium]|nr:hypothetical protein [Clostridia bacterium]
MGNLSKSEWLEYKVKKQQEDIDYLREVISNLRSELQEKENAENEKD